MKKNNIIVLLTFVIVAIVFCFPIFKDVSYWGRMDWDQFTFWNAVPRETILKYHQFPLWNPYANGGNVLLAHPHSSFLSPFYIFVLLFGPALGLKMQIIIHLVVGLLGMFWLAQHMKLSRHASYLSSLIFMLNSMYALHLSDGHANWLLLAFFPWVFLYYLKSIGRAEYIRRGSLLLGLLVLGGDVDIIFILVVFCLTYAVFQCAQLRQITPMKAVLFIFLGAFLLCAVKLVPMLEFLNEYPRLTDESTGTDLLALYKILLGREQAFSYGGSWQMSSRLGLKYGWHEYGAYVGVLPLLLYVGGAMARLKDRWPLVVIGLIFLVISLGDKSPVDLWRLLHGLPFYNSLHVPSRYLLGFIFSLSLLAGFGFSDLEKFLSGMKWTGCWVRGGAFALVLFVFIDLWQVNSPIFKGAFIIPPLEQERQSVFAQRYDKVNWHGKGVSHSSMYPILLSNSGIRGAYEVVNVKKGDVLLVSEPGYRGEVYLEQANGSIVVKYFSPNKIVFDAHVTGPDRIVVNQNYYRGWKVRGDEGIREAEAYKGLISTRVFPGQNRITFYYLPTSFLVGLCVTIVSIIVAVGFSVLRARGGVPRIIW